MRRIRAEVRQWARESRGLLLQLLAVSVAVVGVGVAVSAWVPSSNDYVQGLLNGVVLTSLVAMAVAVFFVTTGSLYRAVGTLAEDGTRDELERAQRAGEIHGYVTNVELAGYDIDALVVTGTAVLALETKWHRTWPDEAQLLRDVAAALSAARHTRSVLRSIGQAGTPVTGVLVLWSPEPCPWESSAVVDGIVLMAGDQLRPWLQANGRQGMDTDAGRALAAELEHFARSHGPYAVAKPGSRGGEPPPSSA